MRRKSPIISNIYNFILVFLFLLVFVGIPLKTDGIFFSHKADMLNFSKTWKVNGDTIVLIDELWTGNYGGTITASKVLPNNLTDSDELCFESRDTNVTVYLDAKEIYSFRSAENMTGLGYGVAFHQIGLCSEYDGQTVTIKYEGVKENQLRGSIFGVYICPSSYYMRYHMSRVLLPCLFCIVTFFFGVVLVLISIVAFDEEKLPFNIFALGISAMVLGLWLFIDTNILKLMTGNILVWHDMSRILPFMSAYPLILFYNSLTMTKRKIYHHLSFWISIIFGCGIIFLRYLFDVDMMFSYARGLISYIIVLSCLILIITYDNIAYFKRMNIKYDVLFLHIGIAILLGCCFLDLIIYFFNLKLSDTQGTYARIGLTIFVMIMLLEFLKWWMRDHADIERDRFITRALQYAVSSNSPEVSIKSMLSFLGTELEAKRIFIFEDQKNGKFRGTYEWYGENAESADLDIMYLPYNGIVDKLYEEIGKSDRKLIINYPETYKNSIPAFYNLLKSNNVDSLILGPLELNGKLFGICGVIGISREAQKTIAEILDLISYFLTQLIVQREEQRRLFYYNFNDVLTGARNQMAYRKFIEGELDTASAFGYVRCALIGLEEINAIHGYDAGDKIVTSAAKSLMEVFGESNVYRINGLEFAIFGFETDELFFNNDVERASEALKESDISACFAAVYCLYGTHDINTVIKKAEEKLQTSKT